MTDRAAFAIGLALSRFTYLLLVVLVCLYVASAVSASESQRFGLGESATTVLVNPPSDGVPDLEGLRADLEKLLRESDSTIVFESSGEGNLGLGIFDPTHRLLNRDGSVTFSFSDSDYQSGSRTVLTKANSYLTTLGPLERNKVVRSATVIGTYETDGPARSSQYAYTFLGAADFSGQYITSSSAPDFPDDLAEILASHGYSAAAIPPPPILTTVLASPVGIALAATLILCLTSVTLFWITSVVVIQDRLRIHAVIGATPLRVAAGHLKYAVHAWFIAVALSALALFAFGSTFLRLPELTPSMAVPIGAVVLTDLVLATITFLATASARAHLRV